ncbi:MAG: hypothetical protein WD471_01410 [Candidatus Paceibacterota bacterium]
MSLKDKKIKFTKQSIFIALAVLFLGLIIWFSINNFVFLVDGLNKAVNYNVEIRERELEFDLEKFESLELSR